MLAATLSTVYGIYNGFELCEGTPIPGKEEYLDSEKYEIKAWDCDRPGNIQRLRHPAEPHPPRQPGAAGVHEPALLQCLERQHPLLRQDDRGQGQHRPGRGQPRPAPRAGGQLRGAAVGAHPAGLGRASRSRICSPARRSSGTARCSTSGSIRASIPAPSGGSRRPACRAERRRDAQPNDGTTTRDDRSQPSRLVQGRHHLSAARQGVLRCQQRRHRRLRRPDAEARLPPGARRQYASGCCRSIPRRCATTATTSPTTATSTRPTARCATSGASCARRTSAACA